MPELGEAAPTFTTPDSWESFAETIEEFYRKGWTDGLPVVPPTPDLVQRMVERSGRDPRDLLGPVPPRMGLATVETVAANAVMAGCLPEYFPVVLATVEAALDERFNLNGLQATTHPAGPLIIISGPVVKDLDINYGTSAFGPGYRSNATIGRALRLVMMVLGGGYPETGDKSVLGSPGKYVYCIGESPDAPWGPLHRDFGADSPSGVTVIGCDSPNQYASGGPNKNPDVILLDMVEQVQVCWHMIRRGGEALFVLNPIIARSLHDAGWTKRDIGEHIHEQALVPMKRMLERHRMGWNAGAPEDVWPATPEDLDDATMMPVLRKPEHLLLTVAGGLQATFCACIQGWGYMGGWATSRPIRTD
jgi:hypothetical protein